LVEVDVLRDFQRLRIEYEFSKFESVSGGKVESESQNCGKVLIRYFESDVLETDFCYA